MLGLASITPVKSCVGDPDPLELKRRKEEQDVMWSTAQWTSRHSQHNNLWNLIEGEVGTPIVDKYLVNPHFSFQTVGRKELSSKDHRHLRRTSQAIGRYP